MIEEISIIRDVLDGDIKSFRLLVQRYQGPVIRMIKNIIDDHHICEDIAQDVFFTAYKKLSSFDPDRSSFSTWLFTIARNKSINAAKKKIIPSVSNLPENPDSSVPVNSLERQEFFDRHVFYDGRHISTQLYSALLESWAKPRPMTDEERAAFLEEIFAASNW